VSDPFPPEGLHFALSLHEHRLKKKKSLRFEALARFVERTGAAPHQHPV